MSAPSVAVAKGVRDALLAAGSGEFSQDFTPYFDFKPTKAFPDVIEATEANNWIVPVTLGNAELERSARKRWGETYPVHIGLLVDCRKVSPETGLDEDIVEEAITLLDEIYRYLRNRMIEAGGDKFGILTVDHDPIYDPEDLDSGLFAGVLVLRYRTDR